MRCPICKKSIDEDPPARPATFPFCSERCKLIDLGRWLSGKYQVLRDDLPEQTDDDRTRPADEQ